MLAKVPWIPFDDLAKVPFFVAGAGVEGGRRVASPIQSCDVALTCLDAIEARPPMPFFDTESLLPTLRGAPANDERAVFCAFSMGWPMIRRGNMKYIWHWSGDHVLFDLGEDPGETRSLASAHRSLCDELSIHMQLQMRRPMYELWVEAP
jgi:choline-sulfatase